MRRSRVPLVLVVDDEPETRRYLTMNLRARGYRVATAESGVQALKVVHDRPIDLVIMDLVMPEMDGIEALRRIRQESDVPVLMLSVRTASADKVKAFGRGADDYITKPFGARELIARVEAALRRTRGAIGEASEPNAGDIQIDVAARAVLREGKRIPLSSTELAILSLLVRNADRMLTHRFILERIWGPSHGHDTEYLRAYIYRLRKKIEQDPSDPVYIRSVPGFGYMFVRESSRQPR